MCDVVKLYQQVQTDPRMVKREVDLSAIVRDVINGWHYVGHEIMYMYDTSGCHLLAFAVGRDIDHVNKNVHVSRILALRPEYMLVMLQRFSKMFAGYTITAYRRGRWKMYSTDDLQRIINLCKTKIQDF